MNLLVTLDANYIPHLEAMLKSIYFSNRNEEFNLYVIHSSLDHFDIERIKNAAPNIFVHPITVDDSLFDGAHFTKRISKETYYRLLLCDYLPKTLDRILYLDPDIIVLNSLSNIYNTKFDGNCFIGAGHTYGVVERFNKKRLKMSENSTYINAGFLMINLNNLRKYISSKIIFDYVDKMGKKLFQADQDVLNALFCDKTIYVEPEIYNLDERTLRKKKKDLDFVRENTVIVHYDGKNKPWKENYKGSLDCFYNYFARVPFIMKSERRSIIDEIQRFVIA